MITRMQYKIISNFVSSSDILKIKEKINNIQRNVDWFKMTNDSSLKVSRSQTRPLYKRNSIHSELFKIIESSLEIINLKLIFDQISPRKYEIGDFMEWHSDYSSYPISNTLEYECILVLENTSDSITQFKVEDRIEDYVSKEGDLLILCRQGIEHQVTKVTKGNRLTLKFTACDKDLQS